MFPLMVRSRFELNWELNSTNSHHIRESFLQTWLERTCCSREDELPLEKLIKDNSCFGGHRTKMKVQKGVCLLRSKELYWEGVDIVVEEMSCFGFSAVRTGAKISGPTPRLKESK